MHEDTKIVIDDALIKKVAGPMADGGIRVYVDLTEVDSDKAATLLQLGHLFTWTVTLRPNHARDDA